MHNLVQHSTCLIILLILYNSARAAAPRPIIAPATGTPVGTEPLSLPTAAVLACEARLEPREPASDATDPTAAVTVSKAPSAPEVTVEKTPSAPDVTTVARLVATDSALLATSVATETTPEVTSPKTDVMSERIWADASGAATRLTRTTGRTILMFSECFDLFRSGRSRICDALLA